MSSEQMQNIIEYLPTTDERKALESYMLSGGIDAAEKFDGLCECEKFMVAMMTVKYAKRKVQALMFKLQFGGCLQSLVNGTFLRYIKIAVPCVPALIPFTNRYCYCGNCLR